MKNNQRMAFNQGIKPRTMANYFKGPAGFRMILAGLLVGAGMAQANPTGGSIAAGSANISGQGTSSVTINQFSNTAVINWNTFSIGGGELTTFVQPSAASAVLNRVTGGGTSIIAGTLDANGQVFLVNGNGIFISKSGMINTAGFTASTLDISNKDFENGNLKFSGSAATEVQNLGAISAMGGDIYLIGQTVDNEGSLSAANGTVGLAAAQSVLIKQSGTQHVFVNPSSTAKPNATATGVTNNGLISATAAELRAANGNMYALAINNGGTIRATTVQKQGGHVYLTSDGGVIVNTGTIDASATAAGGTGGTIQLKTSSSGTVVHHGTILAHGGQGGTGGTVDLSGGNLDFTGGVDLTSPGGKTGALLLDPQSIDIIGTEGNGVVTTTGTITTYTPAPGFTGVSTLSNTTLEAQLMIANVIVNGINNVTVDAPVTWTNATASTEGMEFANTLTLETGGNPRSPGTIVINQPITAHLTDHDDTSMPSTGTLTRAGLTIDDIGNGFVTTGPDGSIDVDNFTMENGIWQQIVSVNAPTKTMPGLMAGPLPGFNVTNDFQLDNTSTFERFAGGNGLNPTTRAPGNSPYQIVDIYGLQGIGSPSDKLLNGSYILDNDIDYVANPNPALPGTVTNSTINWNGGDGIDGGAGFLPIGEGGSTVKPFTGTFNGNNFLVAGYYDYRPADTITGLFGEVSGGTIENVQVDTAGGQGIDIGGVLIGRLLSGTVNDCFTSFDAVPEPAQPATPGNGTIANQANIDASKLGVANASGGLIGEVLAGGKVIDSESFLSYKIIGGNGVEGLVGVAGLVGVNYGTITDCSTIAGGTTAISVAETGARNPTAKTESISLGGLVGTNFGTINGGSSQGTVSAIAVAGTLGNMITPGTAPGTEGSILSGVGNFVIGGFVGTNYGTIDSTVTVGGLHGTKVSYQAFTTANVTGPAGGDVQGGSGSYYVGGFVGLNYGKVSNAYSAPSIGGATDNAGDPLAPGGIVTGEGNIDGASGTLNGGTGSGALGDYVVGGFAGGNFGSISVSGTEDTVMNAGSITGVGSITVKNMAEPQPANFGSPLALDSFFVGGFVGLNGSGSHITGSFSDPASQQIQFTLDPTNPVPTLAATGDTFTVLSDPPTENSLISTTGNILGGTGYYLVGGFAGGNYGSISTSYSAGNVNVSGTTAQSNSFYTGGFAGVSSGTIANVYEQGNVQSMTTTGTPAAETGVVGGLIGQMNGGAVSYTYSIGEIRGGTTRGGVVGVDARGSVKASFWDTDNNDVGSGGPGAYSAGGAGAMGEPGTALQVDMADEAASVYAASKWNFKTIWVAPASPGFPTLLGVP
jgi:filamentous hemagglutinin family protein